MLFYVILSGAVGFGGYAGVLAEEGAKEGLVGEVEGFADLLNREVLVG